MQKSILILLFAVASCFAWYPTYRNVRAYDSLKVDSLKGGLPLKADISGKIEKCTYLKDTSYLITGSLGDSVRYADTAGYIINLPAIDSARIADSAIYVRNLPAIDSARFADSARIANNANIADTVKHQRLSIVTQGPGITVTRSADSFQVSLYSLPAIYSFSNTSPTHYAGQTVTSDSVYWTLTGAPITSQSLTDAGSINIALRGYKFSGSWTTDKYWTLSIDTGTTVVGTATTWMYFYIQKFWGTSANAAPSEGDIEAGSSSWVMQAVANRALGTTTITGGGGYIFYSFPASWGTVYLLDGANPITWNVTTVSLINAYGDTRNYTCYTSPNTIVGTIHLTATGN
jgi:hypothetical protein